jgi:hypothetical protein
MKTFLDGRRFLVVYSGVLTVAFGALVLVAANPAGRESFDEIDVQRINVVEPDGTIRLVLSSKARLPGILFGGEEYEHPTRRTAGILFYNDEGTENGGLVFGGETDSTGKVSAYGHLSFDQYEQDQVLVLDATEDGGNRKAGVSVWDRPDWSIEELIRLVERVKDLPESERNVEYSRFFADRERAHPRLYLGKSHDGSVSLRLNDAEGRERLIVQVAADGTPAVRFLDEEGEEVARFPAGAGD